ncbi:MAG: hypothetical protein IPH48_01090 [bacterium]|nr:hypothetical protein [bacterium]
MRCNWPNGTVGAFYNGEIYVSTGEHWNENVSSHEYGHHWVQNFAINTAPDYCNGICDNGGCGHCIWCRETDHDAFNEGYPDWMGDVIPAPSPRPTAGRRWRATTWRRCSSAARVVPRPD